MRSLYLIILITIIGCVSDNKTIENLLKPDSLTYENKALIFFKDSLLHNKNIFGNEINGAIYNIPFMDTSMYVNGLFKDKEVFYSQTSVNLTKPYADSSEFEYYNEDEVLSLKELYRDFESKSKTDDTVRLVSIDQFNVLDWDSYTKDINMRESIYLVVHRSIGYRENRFVQLEFRDVDLKDMYFTHDFYFKMDSSGTVVNWWINE